MRSVCKNESRGGGGALCSSGGAHQRYAPSGQGHGIHVLKGAWNPEARILDGRGGPPGLEAPLCCLEAASSRGPMRARLFLEDMVQLGEEGYARRNHRVTRIMQLPPGNRQRAVCSFQTHTHPHTIRTKKELRTNSHAQTVSYSMELCRNLAQQSRPHDTSYMAHRNKQTVPGAQSQLQPGFTRSSLSISEHLGVTSH